MPIDLSMYREPAPPAQRIMTPNEFQEGANILAQQKQAEELNRQKMLQNAVTLRQTTQEADKYARDVDEHAGVVNILKKYDPDNLGAAIPELAAKYPLVAQKFKEVEDSRISARNDEIAQAAADVRTVKNPDERVARQKAHFERFSKSRNFTAADLQAFDPSKPYDDATLDAIIAGSASVQKARQDALKAQAEIDEKRAKAGLDTAQAAHVQTQARAGTLGNIGQLLGATVGQTAWTALYDQQPPEIQAVIGPIWSPEAQKRAQQLGLTSEQRSTAESKAATAAQTAARDAENVTHHRAMEARPIPGTFLTANEVAVQNRADQNMLHNQRMVFQKEIESGQAKIDALQKDRKAAEANIAKNEQIIAENPLSVFGGKSAARKKAEAELAAAKKAQESIVTQQNETKSRMNASQNAKDTIGTPAVTPAATQPSPAVTAPPVKAPATPTAQAPVKGKGGPTPEQQVRVQLPNGQYLTGTQAQVEAALKMAGMSLKK